MTMTLQVIKKKIKAQKEKRWEVEVMKLVDTCQVDAGNCSLKLLPCLETATQRCHARVQTSVSDTADKFTIPCHVSVHSKLSEMVTALQGFIRQNCTNQEVQTPFFPPPGQLYCVWRWPRQLSPLTAACVKFSFPSSSLVTPTSQLQWLAIWQTRL